ncbi:MAG: uroporphyrinogen-III C-methyltransferase, partial [Burkholderiales bacterium]|nr:uroporphyrinogen-III C-methyltransferase [Burkholderiales bacterium]
SVAQLSPSKTGIVLSQVNSLISSANQSIILYHNITSAIKLLDIAKQTLTVSDDPLFDSLKVALTHDINNLNGQDQYDTTILQTQIGDLNSYIYALTSIKPNQEKPMVKEYSGSKWDNFKENVTGTLQGLFSINQQKNSLNSSDSIRSSEILIQLSLNVRQAMLTYNQDAWNKNLTSIKEDIIANYASNIEGQKILELIKSLEKVNFDNKNNNLDATIQALSKTNQLYGN